MTPQTGRMVKENGTTANIADLIGGTDTGERVNIDMMAPKSGRFVKEDGSVVNLADVIEEFLAGLAGGGSGSGGAVSLKKLTITVNGTEYTYDGKSAVSIPITTGGGGAAAGQPLQITIGETTYTYTGAEPVTLEIPVQGPLPRPGPPGPEPPSRVSFFPPLSSQTGASDLYPFCLPGFLDGGLGPMNW